MSGAIAKDLWYLDVRGKIQRLATQQIIDLLLKNEVKVIHRVSRTQSSWKAICNEIYFESAIQDLIDTLSKEATKYESNASDSSSKVEMSGFHNLKNLKSGINEQLHHAQILQNINYRLHGLRHVLSEIASKRKHVVDMSVKEVKDEMHVDDRNEYINQPGFWSQFSKYFNFKKSRFWVYVIRAVFFVSCFIFFGSKYLQLQVEKETQAEVSKLQEAVLAKTMGDYNRAIELFSGVKNLQSLDAKALMAMAESFAQAKRYEKATELVNLAITPPLNKNDLSQVNNRLGRIAQQNGQPDVAKGYYLNSLQNGTLYSSLLNLGIIYLEMNDYQLAEDLLLKAIEVSGHDPMPALLSLSEVAVQLDKQQAQNLPAINFKLDKLNLRAKKADELIELVKKPESPFYQLLLASQIVLAAQARRDDRFNKLVAEWLDLDPSAKDVNPQIYEEGLDYRRTTWRHMYKRCLETYSGPYKNNLKSAFYAGCVARTAGFKEAIPFVLYSYNNAKVDPVLRGFLGYLTIFTGNAEGARQVLRSGDLNGSRLGALAMVELCNAYPDSVCHQKKSVRGVTKAK